MDLEVKHLWVEALRSGNYQKGSHCLRNFEDKYCCLGVLCDIAVQKGIIKSPVQDNMLGGGAWRYSDEPSVLPDDVAHWAGLDLNPVVQHNGYATSLAVLNDTVYDDFGPIAAIIEEQL